MKNKELLKDAGTVMLCLAEMVCLAQALLLGRPMFWLGVVAAAVMGWVINNDR